MKIRLVTKTALLTLIAAAIVPSAALAHLTVQTDETAVGARSTAVFKIGHGCGEDPTTEVSIKVPEGITGVKPEVDPLWDIEVTMESLDDPIEGEQGDITEVPTEITYTATGDGIPNDRFAELRVSTQWPGDASAGDRLVFPAVQSCPDGGEEAWIEVADEGSDEELEKPAPYVTLTEATGDGHGGSDKMEKDDSDAADEGDDDEGDTLQRLADLEEVDDRTALIAVGGFILGFVALFLAVIAWRRKS